MTNEKLLRQYIVKLLKTDGAHADFAAAVRDMPLDLRGKKPKGAEHSPWEVLEHLRITQGDALEFIRNANHVELEFPAGYWPHAPVPPNDGSWEKSVNAFCADLAAIIELVQDESTDLLAAIPHGDGKTILREVLMVADHNAYHLGELVLLRRLLGAWTT